MTMHKLLLALSVSLIAGCTDSSSGLNSSEEAPSEQLPEKLSQTILYEDFGLKKVNGDLLHFEPQFPLWTDGAKKHRWIYLPSKIDASNMNSWVFPVGTTVFKEFSHNGKRVETRILKKIKAEACKESWLYGAYQWNQDDSEATLVPEDGVKDASATSVAGITHDIPTHAQCVRCHGKGGDTVLGFDALQLEGEGSKENVKLKWLFDNQLLSHLPQKPIRDIVKSEDEVQSIGYFHGNCSACHNPGGNAMYTGLFLNYDANAATRLELPVFQKAVNKHSSVRTMVGKTVGVDSYIIQGGSAAESLLFYRMSSRGDDWAQMPPIDSKIQDQKALDVIGKWINSLPQPFIAAPKAE